MTERESELAPHLERIRSRIGSPIGPFHHLVEKGALIKFARSIGEQNRLYLDEDYAKTTRFGALPASPSYISVFIRSFFEGGCFDLEVPLKRFLHGEDVVAQHLPILAGDRLTASGSLVDARIRKGRAGLMLFQILEVRITNEEDALVGSIGITGVNLD